MNTFDRQLQDIAALLSGPIGVVVALLALAAMISAVFSPRVRWIVLVVLLLSTTFTLPTFSFAKIGQGSVLYRPLMFPFESMRTQSRAISGAMVCILFLPSILAPLGWRRTLLPLGLVAYFTFQITFSVLDVSVDPSLKTFLSLPLFAMTFVVMAVGLNKTCQRKQDVNALLWAVITAFALMSAAITVQLLAGDRTGMFEGNRLRGTTANPQFLATSIAPAIMIAVYLLLDKGQSKILRAGLGVVTTALILFLFWTGSRTGVLMSAMGVLVFFRLRLGQLLLAAAVIAVCVMGVLQFLGQEGSDPTGRFIGMQDTRSDVWYRQWSEFADSPLLGATVSGGGRATGNGENSYLAVAASYGLVGLIPLGLVLLTIAWDMFCTWRIRRFLTEEQSLVDLVLAVTVMAFVGAFFEVYLLGQFSAVVLTLFICCDIGAYLRDLASIQQKGLGSGGVSDDVSVFTEIAVE